MQNTKQTRSTLELVGDTINTANSRLSRKSLAPSKKKRKRFVSTVTQFAVLREILAQLHHRMFEVGFAGARFHPLHIDNNRASPSTMSAVSQQL